MEITLTSEESIFSDNTLTDWVSFTEQLSVVKVLSESRIPLEDEAAEAREGYVGRKLTLEIQSTVWSAPKVAPASGEISMFWLGWAQSKNVLRRLVSPNAPRIVVGGTYVAPLLHVGDEWGFLSHASALAFESDRIATEDVRQHGQSEVARQLSGLSTEMMTDLMNSTAPYPAAARNWDLPPYERFKAVQLER